MAKDYEGKTLKVGDHLGWFNFGGGGNHGTITKIIDDNHVEVKDVDGHIYPISLTSERYVLSNSRACNSTNLVVRKAMNACGKNAAGDNDDVLAAFRTGCKKVCEQILMDIKKLKAHVYGSQDLFAKQPEPFRNAVKEVIDSEFSLKTVTGYR